MDKVDLSLVPIEDLVEEIKKRHTAYVIATLRIETGNEPMVQTYWSEKSFIDCLGICSGLEEDIKQFYMRPKEKE